MNLISSEKKEKNEIELKIKVTPEELEAAINKAYLKNRNRIGVPGFRKGKAPRKIIEKMYGVAIFMNDALDSLLPDVLKFAMKDTDLDIVGYPKISNIDLKDNDTWAEITLIAALRPEVKLKKYKGLSAEKPSIEVPKSEIDSELEAMRQRNARMEPAERPAKMGDIAVINFEGFLDGVPFDGGKGENYDLELGSGSFIPGFEEKVEGMEIGEERDIDLVFPENYKEDLAGKAVVFKVKLNEVKEKQLPALDDEFAKDVSEFDTLDEYKASIKAKIEEKRKTDVDETFENILMEQITDEMEADVPDAMIEEQLERSMDSFSRQISAYGMQPEQYMQMLGITPDTFKEKMRGNAEKQVKTSLALAKIAELEDIEISDKEIEEEYEAAAKQYKIDLEKIQKEVPRADIIHDLKLRKAVKIVIDSAKAEKPKAAPAKAAKDTEKPAQKPAAAKKPEKKAEKKGE
ncbi:MAG: trigger factor [Oscillospiraceae bacterium]|nr:trigger factor [Oscillospiraceae bacterium]